MRHVETLRTLVLTMTSMPAFFEALLCENMGLGRPQNVEQSQAHGDRFDS